MTSPEAIAAAERLLVALEKQNVDCAAEMCEAAGAVVCSSPFCAEHGGDQAEPCAECAKNRDVIAVVATLRAALLQSQEALATLVREWEEAAAWEQDAMSNTQSAQTFDQCAVDLRDVLLSLLVAPKER